MQDNCPSLRFLRHSGAALLAFGVLATPALADCGQAVGILQQQLRLIEEAAPLLRDRDAPLQEGSSVSHTIDEALRERTRLSSRGLAGEVTKTADPAAHETAVTAAREAILQAREALNRGDEAQCQQAVSDGQDAVMRARAAL